MERVVIEATDELLKMIEGKWSPAVSVLLLRDASSETGWTMQVKSAPPCACRSCVKGADEKLRGWAQL
jgi:hypothetical protein